MQRRPWRSFVKVTGVAWFNARLPSLRFVAMRQAPPRRLLQLLADWNAVRPALHRCFGRCTGQRRAVLAMCSKKRRYLATGSIARMADRPSSYAQLWTWYVVGLGWQSFVVTQGDLHLVAHIYRRLHYRKAHGRERRVFHAHHLRDQDGFWLSLWWRMRMVGPPSRALQPRAHHFACVVSEQRAMAYVSCRWRARGVCARRGHGASPV